MFHTDAHFLIGYYHLSGGKPCQDYAIAGEDSDSAYAIVADGCSSGRRTDVGARIVALATEAAIHRQTPITTDSIRNGQQAAMAGAIALNVVTERDMLATALTAYVHRDGGFIHLQGDGVVALQYRNGRIDLWRYDWNHNIPLYLAYALDDYVDFRAAHYYASDDALAVEYWIYTPEHGFEQQPKLDYSVDQGIMGITTDISADTLAQLRTLAVFSDGACQIDGMDWKQTVLGLLAFKSTTGEFAKRRLNRFVKEAQKTGKGPMDDIAYAVIHIERAAP